MNMRIGAILTALVLAGGIGCGGSAAKSGAQNGDPNVTIDFGSQAVLSANVDNVTVSWAPVAGKGVGCTAANVSTFTQTPAANTITATPSLSLSPGTAAVGNPAADPPVPPNPCAYTLTLSALQGAKSDRSHVVL